MIYFLVVKLMAIALIEPSSEFFYQMFLAPWGFTLFEVKDLESWKNQPKNLSHCPTNSK